LSVVLRIVNPSWRPQSLSYISLLICFITLLRCLLCYTLRHISLDFFFVVLPVGRSLPCGPHTFLSECIPRWLLAVPLSTRRVLVSHKLTFVIQATTRSAV
jgi:hypothetical protein